MWIKLDDGFATHPKILRAGPNALVVQVRAFCYARRHHTDGFIPTAAVGLFVNDLPECAQGWGSYMVEHGLWEQADRGYIVHDFLDWNLSKIEYEMMVNKLSQAGKKGMKHRWKKGKTNDNPPYKPGYNPPYNESITNPITQQSISIAPLSSLNSSESGPNLQSIPRTKKKSNGLHEWPADFELSEEMKERAVALDMNPYVEFAKFKDNHLAKGSKMKDWTAAWRTWLRRGVEMKEARR